MDLRDVLRRAVKKNLDIVKMIVTSVREMCVEWKDGAAPVNDPALQGNKDPKTGFNIEVDSCTIAKIRVKTCFLTFAFELCKQSSHFLVFYQLISLFIQTGAKKEC